jgi:hypothetical protein
MWLNVPGESHSLGYRKGCMLLQAVDSTFRVNVVESGTPEAFTDQYLRVNKATWGDVDRLTGWQYSYGEEDWYTSAAAVVQTKTHLTYCYNNNRTVGAMGFGWCWDMTWTNSPGGTTDPVYQVRWAGSSDGGPQGNLRWGLDAGDATLTDNSICMDTYLNATTEYVNYCTNNNYPTKVFFTTGPVDGGGNTGESGYQRHLKNEYIRNYVQSMTNGILFDYADILCWSNTDSVKNTTWRDYGSTLRTFPVIHNDNMLDLSGSYTEDGDHIGERGALRLGKALWWMLARIAGWDGNPVPTGNADQSVPQKVFNLSNNYPNPFNPTTTIEYQIPQNGLVTLKVFDLLGHEVATLVDGMKGVGCYTVTFDASHLASGMYFARFTMQQQNGKSIVQTTKLMVTK